jgi:hypothetical protein
MSQRPAPPFPQRKRVRRPIAARFLPLLVVGGCSADRLLARAESGGPNPVGGLVTLFNPLLSLVETSAPLGMVLGLLAGMVL